MDGVFFCGWMGIFSKGGEDFFERCVCSFSKGGGDFFLRVDGDFF